MIEMCTIQRERSASNCAPYLPYPAMPCLALACFVLIFSLSLSLLSLPYFFSFFFPILSSPIYPPRSCGDKQTAYSHSKFNPKQQKKTMWLSIDSHTPTRSHRHSITQTTFFLAISRKKVKKGGLASNSSSNTSWKRKKVQAIGHDRRSRKGQIGSKGEQVFFFLV